MSCDPLIQTWKKPPTTKRVETDLSSVHQYDYNSNSDSRQKLKAKKKKTQKTTYCPLLVFLVTKCGFGWKGFELE